MKKTFSFLTSIFLLTVFLTGCENYGDKVSQGHVEVYYKGGIQKEQAQKAADLLFNIDKTYNNNTSVTKSFQLDKEKDTIVFRMVVNPDQMGKVGDESFNAIGSIISQNVFANAPVNVALTDDKFKTTKTLHYKPMDMTEGEQQQEQDSATQAMPVPEAK